MPKPLYTPNWEARERFITEYAKTGKLKPSAELAGVIYGTAAQWVHETWFKERVAEFKQRYNQQMTLKIRGLLDKAFEHIEDRLEHGELKMVKKRVKEVVDGEEIEVEKRVEERNPITVKDLTILSSVLFDKYHTITKTETPGGGSDAEKTLNNIAAKLRKFEATGRSGDLQDVTTIEADDLC